MDAINKENLFSVLSIKWNLESNNESAAKGFLRKTWWLTLKYDEINWCEDEVKDKNFGKGAGVKGSLNRNSLPVSINGGCDVS